MKIENKKGKWRYLFYAVLACVFISCTSKKEGEIVMDKDGNYYELTHRNIFMGSEMYRLEPIDTIELKIIIMKIENKKGKWFVNGNAYVNMTPTEKEVLNAYFRGLKIEKSCF